jgi:hypothetical protein
MRWLRAGLPAVLALAPAVTVACTGSPHHEDAPAPFVSPSAQSATSSPSASRPRGVTSSPSAQSATSSPSASRPRGVTFAKADRVMHQHAEEIWHRYRKVAGIGIGDVCRRSDCPRDEVFGIIVSLEDASGLPTAPQAIDGVPLEFQVTGRFTTPPDRPVR